MSDFITIYRLTTIGKSLSEALAELQKDNEIREDLSKKVMEQFDKVVCDKFASLPQNQKCRLYGKCINYNNCDDVWKFELTQCNIKGETF